MKCHWSWRRTCEQDISFPTIFTSTPHVWGRGVGTSGTRRSLANPLIIDQKRHCEVKDNSITNSGATLVTYVYKLVGPWPSITEHWYPTSPSNVTWGYAALGKDGIVSVPDQYPDNPGIKVSPNPFNAKTVISFYNSMGGDSAIGVYNVRGERVVEIYKGHLEMGMQEFYWNGLDHQGRECPSAVYFVRAKLVDGAFNKRITLVK